jgi:hypothetical protein
MHDDSGFALSVSSRKQIKGSAALNRAQRSNDSRRPVT